MFVLFVCLFVCYSPLWLLPLFSLFPFVCLFVSFTTTFTEGMLKVNMSMVSLEEVERSLLEKEPSIALGGYWKPRDCLPRWKVSVGETLLGASRRGEYMSRTGGGGERFPSR